MGCSHVILMAESHCGCYWAADQDESKVAGACECLYDVNNRNRFQILIDIVHNISRKERKVKKVKEMKLSRSKEFCTCTPDSGDLNPPPFPHVATGKITTPSPRDS